LLASLNSFFPNAFKLDGSISSDVLITWEEGKKPKFDVKLYSNNIYVISHSEMTDEKIVYPVSKFNIHITGDKKINLQANIFSDGLFRVDIDNEISPYIKTPTIKSDIDVEIPDLSTWVISCPT